MKTNNPPVSIISGECVYELICHSKRVHVTVTSQPTVVEEWVNKTIEINRDLLNRGQRLVVGLGVTWTGRKGTATAIAIATIQLCRGDRCLIFQLLHASHSPDNLNLFLANPGIILVGVVQSGYVKSKLLESHHRLRVERLEDLRRPANYCRRSKLDNASMESLVSEIIGWNGMALKAAHSEWLNICLSEEQVIHAALDAFLSSLIGIKLGVWKYLPRIDPTF